MKVLYTAHATTVAGRDGNSKTDDNRLVVKLSRPASNEPGTNPEQLFACGYSACFGSALSSIAKKKNVILGEVKINADVSLNEDDNGGYFLAVTLNAILPNVDQQVAETLVKDAHQICPYSKATRNNIEVKLQANDKNIS
ncbi:MAG: organic hydroperoxide resistance protein [Pseudomonadota bacterium]